MRKALKVFLWVVLLACPVLLITGCKSKTVVSISAEYIGSAYDYDKFNQEITCEYETAVEFTSEDFVVYNIFEDGRKEALNEYKLDLAGIKDRRLVPGSYAIRFANNDESFETYITLVINHKEIDRPEYESISFMYDGTVKDITSIITSNANFNSDYLMITASSEISASAAGEYKAFLKLKEGYAFKGTSSKFSDVVINWTIQKGVIDYPNASSALEFTFEYDENYQGVIQHPTFTGVSDKLDVSYEDSKDVGEYSVLFTIKPEYRTDYKFPSGDDSYEIKYKINPEILDVPSLIGDGEYEYSGEVIYPNLNGFISTIMNISGVGSERNDYVATISLKDEYKNNFKFKEGLSDISYKIVKRQIARPLLIQNKYEYTGEAIKPIFENLDERFLEVTGYENNIEPGYYSVTIRLKADLDPENFTYVGGDSIGITTERYNIFKPAPLTIKVAGKTFEFELRPNGSDSSSVRNFQVDSGDNYYTETSKDNIDLSASDIEVEFTFLNRNLSDDGLYIIAEYDDFCFGFPQDINYVYVKELNGLTGYLNLEITEDDEIVFMISRVAEYTGDIKEDEFATIEYSKVTIRLV